MGISGVKWGKRGHTKTNLWLGYALLILNILLQICIIVANG